MRVLFRQCKLSDLKQIKGLNERSLAENYDYSFWVSEWEKGKNHSCVAICSGIVVGYIFCNGWSIISVAVDEKFRNKGLGSEMLRHVLNHCTTDLRLYVRASNSVARKLYQKFGFKDSRLLDDYYRNPVESPHEMIRCYDKNVRYEILNKMKIT